MGLMWLDRARCLSQMHHPSQAPLEVNAEVAKVLHGPTLGAVPL